MNKEDTEALFSELVQRLERKDATFTLDGPLMTTVKMKDNTYRRKTIPRANFWLENIYSGQKDLIFVFQFEDLLQEFSEYACVEVSAKDMDGSFPLFLEEAIAWARDRFTPVDASRLKTINDAESVRALVHMAVNFETADALVEATAGEDTLSALPMFGMF